MGSWVMRGSSGTVKKGYQRIARLTAWTFNRDTERIEATAVDLDAFWAEQGGPVTVMLDVGKGEWTWREAEIVSASPMVLRVSGAPSVRAA